jgi:hypothetical protein
VIARFSADGALRSREKGASVTCSYKVSAVLAFVGARITLVDVYKVPAFFSLLGIATLLSVAIAACMGVAQSRGVSNAR